MVGVSFAVLNLTGSTADLSYVLAAQVAPMLVFTLVSGVFADRLRPQWVIIAGNVAVIVGEGTFGLLVLTGHPALWAMICLEALNGIGARHVLPRLAGAAPPDRAGRAAAGGQLDQQAGDEHRADDGRGVGRPGGRGARPRLGADLVRDRHDGHDPADAVAQGRPGRLQLAAAKGAGMLTELREGWTEFRSHTWLWATVIQYALVMMAFNGAFLVLGPVVARTHLGGPAAWGAITAADALGLVAGGLVSLRYTPRKPMLFVVGSGAAIALIAARARAGPAAAGDLPGRVRAWGR